MLMTPTTVRRCFLVCLIGFVLSSTSILNAAAFNCDLAQYQPLSGLTANLDGENLTIQWDGEAGNKLRARFAIQDGVPVIGELAIQPPDGAWRALAKDLRPEFGVTTGVRRTNHGLPEENRWDVFWDTPLNRTSDVRRYRSSIHADRCDVTTNGARLEINFNGLTMGVFSGSLRFTVYRGTNLLRLEAIAQTNEPSVAYKYEAGLKGLSADQLPRVVWRDVKQEPKTDSVAGTDNNQQVVLRARNRLAIAEGSGGSIAIFPPPHQFFFARELEVNLG